MKCINCGEREAKIGYLCYRCFYDRKVNWDKVVDYFDRLRIKKCKICGNIFYKNKVTTIPKIYSILREKVSEIVGDVPIEFIYEDNKITIIFLDEEGPYKYLDLEIEEIICEECMIKRQDRYNVLVQIRGSRDFISKVKEILINRGVKIVKEENKRRGVDVKIRGNPNYIWRVVNEIKKYAEIKRSSSTRGFDFQKGYEKKIVTFSIREKNEK